MHIGIGVQDSRKLECHFRILSISQNGKKKRGVKARNLRTDLKGKRFAELKSAKKPMLKFRRIKIWIHWNIRWNVGGGVIQCLKSVLVFWIESSDTDRPRNLDWFRGRRALAVLFHR